MFNMLQTELEEKELQYTFIEQRRWEPFTPLVERVAQEVPELLPGLYRLQEKMLPADFEKYINSLISLRKGNDLLLLITGKEMYRSMIEMQFLNVIQESFAVKRVRVISQG